MYLLVATYCFVSFLSLYLELFHRNSLKIPVWATKRKFIVDKIKELPQE